MTDERFSRAEPCTTCGQPGELVRVYSGAVGHGHGKLAAEYLRHVGREYASERVDAECSFPAELLP
jgi:hypothetical protein